MKTAVTITCAIASLASVLIAIMCIADGNRYLLWIGIVDMVLGLYIAWLGWEIVTGRRVYRYRRD